MKMLDKVRVVTNRNEYNSDGIFEGMIGTIINAEIRDNEFYIIFNNPNKDNYLWACIKIKDLELIEEGNATDDILLEDIPKNNPMWWCKVEDGFIKNLNGDKKNKIAYDYDS